MKMVQMTAVGGPEVMELVDVPEPQPGPGEVRVANQAIAINFHEINERRGQGHAPELPAALGSDFAGLIDALGSGVEHLKLGDRVVGMTLRGAYAEKSCAPGALVMPIPEGVSPEQAASCPVAGLTAHFLLRDNHVGPDTTLVAYAGAGSVGCFVGGLAKRIGCTSIALVSTEEKAAVAKQAGYTFVVEYRQQEPVAAVRELTGGRGADLVLDSVAGPDFERSFDMCAPDGIVELFGHAAGDPSPQALFSFLGKARNLGLRHFFLGTTIATRMPEIAPAFQALFTAFREGDLHLPITRMPLAEVREAHRRIEAQETVGKVILQPQ
ncbi:MAG: zinc-binding dehydrogenase [Deltaproteobacteria bacterium]|nr:zinc-binding dehydrogenase [Deltaproteobacteria bacterium]